MNSPDKVSENEVVINYYEGEENFESDDEDDNNTRCFASLNPFTGLPVSDWYIRRSVRERPGAYYWVNRLDGRFSWSCPEIGFQFPPQEVDDAAENPRRLCKYLSSDESLEAVDDGILITAEMLDSVDVCHFGHQAEGVRSCWIIGGTHGNEYNGILGAQMLHQFLKRPDFSITRKILKQISVSVVECINKIGHMANARSCPNKESFVRYKDGSVIIAEHEHGSLSPPHGWRDPNRGWEVNTTLVKDNVKDIMEGKYGRKPDWALFTHDWAAFLPKVGFYEPPACESLESLAKELSHDCNISSSSSTRDNSIMNSQHPILESVMTCLFSKFYPVRNGMGKPWSFTKCCNNSTLCKAVADRYGIPVFFVENYIGRSDGAFIHLNVCLLMLAKEAMIDMDDRDLVELILSETGRFSSSLS